MRIGLVMCAALITGFAATADSQRPATAAAAPKLSDSALATHLLNRLTFGPRPGDVGAVLRMGTERWIERQLLGDTALDQSAKFALNGCDLWTEPVTIAEGRLSGEETFVGMRVSVTIGNVGFQGLLTRDSAANLPGFGAIYAANTQLVACKYARSEFADAQLLEVMTDFWHNHFSLSGAKLPARGSVIGYDRATIRPNALGKFRVLLGAVAHDPAMLNFLDNALSQADPSRRTLKELVVGIDTTQQRSAGLNENYARELLELHTMGSDGGYSQEDVVEVARAFTGWTHSRVRLGNSGGFSVEGMAGNATAFFFDSAAHDAEEKVVLGKKLAAGRGLEDGEEVLDIIARHPSTAKFIARKLAVRFVSDDPPQSLIDSAATVFLKSDGDIRQVLRTIVRSPEFRSPAAAGSKLKSPLEFVLSLRRILNAPVDLEGEQIDLLINLKQPPYGKLTPEGWPETAAPWLTVGTMKTRLEITNAVARGTMKSIPVERWREWQNLVLAPFDKQLNGVIRHLLNGQVSDRTRSIMEAVRTGGAQARDDVLRELIELALSSPEFMSR